MSLELVKDTADTVDTVDAEIVDNTMDLPALAAAANRWHTVATSAAQSTVKAAIAAGEALIAAKAQCKHGKWLPWLAENFDGDRSSAANYMRIASNVERAPHLDSAESLRQALDAIRKATRPRREPAPKADRDRKAAIAAAIDTLRDSRHGRIVPMIVAEVIGEMTTPSEYAAGVLADAITRHWGSWAAFDKDRKNHNAAMAEQQRTLTKAIFGK